MGQKQRKELAEGLLHGHDGWQGQGRHGNRQGRHGHGALLVGCCARDSARCRCPRGGTCIPTHIAYTPVLHMHQMTDVGHNRLTSSTARGYRVTFHRGCDMSQCIAYLSGGSAEQELRQHARSPLWPRQVRERDGEDVRALRRLQGSSSRLRVADPGSLPV
jgi:hypothetical protein